MASTLSSLHIRNIQFNLNQKNLCFLESTASKEEEKGDKDKGMSTNR